jgi:hypothetical protein
MGNVARTHLKTKQNQDNSRFHDRQISGCIPFQMESYEVTGLFSTLQVHEEQPADLPEVTGLISHYTLAPGHLTAFHSISRSHNPCAEQSRGSCSHPFSLFSCHLVSFSFIPFAFNILVNLESFEDLSSP